MIRFPSWLLATTLHLGVAGSAFYFGHKAVSEAPVVSVSASTGSPLVIDTGREERKIEFTAPIPIETVPLEVQDVPVEIALEKTPLDLVFPVDPARPRPEPRFDRPLQTLLTISRPMPSDAAPQVEADNDPVAIHNPPPQYPLIASRHGIEGEVLIEVLILADGNCADPKVVECKGSPAFQDAAVNAIRNWRFRPAMAGGQPVPATHRIRVSFKLKA